jgi:hypothetical protein
VQVAVGCATPVLEYVPEGAEEPVKVRAPRRLRTALFGLAPETKPASCQGVPSISVRQGGGGALSLRRRPHGQVAKAEGWARLLQDARRQLEGGGDAELELDLTLVKSRSESPPTRAAAAA